MQEAPQVALSPSAVQSPLDGPEIASHGIDPLIYPFDVVGRVLGQRDVITNTRGFIELCKLTGYNTVKPLADLREPLSAATYQKLDSLIRGNLRCNSEGDRYMSLKVAIRS